MILSYLMVHIEEGVKINHPLETESVFSFRTNSWSSASEFVKFVLNLKAWMLEGESFSIIVNRFIL